MDTSKIRVPTNNFIFVLHKKINRIAQISNLCLYPKLLLYDSMKRKIIIPFTILGIGLLVLYNLGIYPFIVNENIPDNSTSIQNENKPFEQFDFLQGGYTAYVVIGFSDLMSPSSKFPNSRVLKSSDCMVLNQLRNCEFNSTGYESLKIDSHIYILKNDSAVYKSGLVLDNNYEGILYENIGWAESRQKGQLAQIISKFEKELKPIIFLR